MSEYSETDYLALGHYLRREMFGVELNEDEQILATMSILKFPEIVIPEDSDEEKIREIRIGDKRGLISKDRWIAKPIYDWVFNYCFYACVKLGGKYGFTDKNGTPIGDGCVYDDAFCFDYGRNSNGEDKVARVRLNDKYGFIDKEGRALAGGIIYDYVDVYKNDMVFFKIGEKYGYMDRKGKILGDGCVYDYAGQFGTYARVKFEGKNGYIDKKGNFYDKLP
jgi:hypothetical protein